MAKKRDADRKDETEASPVVLVVDDDEALLELMQRTLDRAGFRTEGILTGNEAIERIIADPPDLMVLDFRLSDMTGKQLITMLSQRQRMVPFIVGTGRGDEVIAADMMKHGARDYLVKDQTYLERLPHVVKLVMKQLATEREVAEAEEALRESEERYRLLVEAMPDYVITTSQEGIIQYANRTLYADVEAYIGEHTSDFLEPEFRSEHNERIRRACETGEALMGEVTTVFGRDMAETIVPFKKHGEVCEVMIVSHDITERKQAEEALLEERFKLREYFENLPLLSYNVSFDGNIVDCNNMAVKTLGYASKDDLVGKPVVDTIYAPSSREKARWLLEKWRKEWKLRNEELQIITKQGEVIDVLLNVDTIFDHSGKPIHSLSTQLDITERKLAEEALRESEERYRGIFDSVPISVILVDKDGQMVDVNPFHLTHIAKGQVAREEFVGRNIVTHPTIVEAGLSETYRRLLEGESFSQEGVYFPRLVMGGSGYFNVRGEPLLKDGEVVGAVLIHEDITDRKQAEEALRESEKKLRGFMESAADTFLVLDSELNVTEINRQGMKRFEEVGLKQKDVIGNNLSDIVPDLRESGRYDMYLDVIRTGKPLIVEDFVPHPKFGHMHAILKAFKVGTGLGIIATDITERRQMEEALRDSEERLRVLADAAWEAIVIHDEGVLIHANKQFFHMFGREASEPFGMEDALTPESLADIVERINSGDLGPYEATGVRKDGTHFTIEVSAKPMEYRGAAVRVAAIRDITERKLAEEALRESEEKFRSLVENAPALIIIADREGKIGLINRTVPGVTPGDAVGKSIFEYVPAEHYDEMRRSIEHVFETGEPCDYEVAGVGPEGATSWYSTRAGPIKSNGQVIAATLICTDITERKNAEQALQTYSERLQEMVEARTKALRDAQEQLVRQERLATLGQLAGSVSHELRNPLGAIKNAAYFLNMALENPDPEVKETLQILETEVAISDRIIGTLLEFARPKPGVWRGLRINDLIQDALSHTTVPENVEVVSQLDESLPEVLGDPDQIGQVFGNIVLNAIQAMTDGGQLVVKSEAPGPEWVSVSFADAGGGIPEDRLGKVFEPLFTTKARGIGLGLALSKSIVERHGGTIEVQSQVGRGSIFTVGLPVGGGERGR